MDQIRPSRNCKRPVRLIEVLEADKSDNEETSPKRRIRLPLTTMMPPPEPSKLEKPKLPLVVESHPPPRPNNRVDDCSLPIGFVADMLETLLIKLDESMAKQQELDRKLTILLCRTRPDMSAEDKRFSTPELTQSSTVPAPPVAAPKMPVLPLPKPTAHVSALPQRRGKATVDKLEFPLKLIPEFDQLEYELTNEHSFNKLLDRLSTIGGNSVERLVKNVLEHMFMYPLTLQINWTGMNNKKALQHTNTFELICRICTKQKGDDDSVRRVVEHHVRGWFRGALERERSRLRRSVLAHAKSQETAAKTNGQSQGSTVAAVRRNSYAVVQNS